MSLELPASVVVVVLNPSSANGGRGRRVSRCSPCQSVNRPSMAAVSALADSQKTKKTNSRMFSYSRLDSRWIIPLTFLLLLANSSVTSATVSKGIAAGPDPEFIEPLMNITVVAGRDVKLHCVVKHLATYKVAWIYMERSAILTVQNHVITRNPRISVSHDQHHTWSLHITSVQESDRGGYMCQVNTAVAKTLVGYIDVIVPPSIDDSLSSSDVVVREQSSVTLTCNATGTPPLTVRWRREDGKMININRTHTVAEWEGTQLELSRVSRLDMAAYLCIASNGVPPTVSKRITLTVEFAPTVTLQQQLIGAPLGSVVSLDCTIESSPTALHFWSRGGDDAMVLHEVSKYLMQSPATTTLAAASSTAPWPSFRTQLRMTIVNVTTKDYGTYRCVAKNPFGEAEGTITFHHTQSATPTTTPSASYNVNPPPAAAVSPAERSQDETANQTQMKLAGGNNNGKVRSGDNTLPTAETGSKPSKSRSESKWNHNNWDKDASSGSVNFATSSCSGWLLLITAMLGLMGFVNWCSSYDCSNHFFGSTSKI